MIHHARGPKSFADAVSRVPLRSSELCLCSSLTLGVTFSAFRAPSRREAATAAGSLCQRRFNEKVLEVGLRLLFTS